MCLLREQFICVTNTSHVIWSAAGTCSFSFNKEQGTKDVKIRMKCQLHALPPGQLLNFFLSQEVIKPCPPSIPCSAHAHELLMEDRFVSDSSAFLHCVFYLVEQKKGFVILPSPLPLPLLLLFASFNGFPVSSLLRRSLSVSALLTIKLFIIYYVLNADNVTCKGCRLKERHLCRCDLCFLQAVFVRILSFHICKTQVGGFYRLFS